MYVEQKCVRRRATLSVSFNPNCATKEVFGKGCCLNVIILITLNFILFQEARAAVDSVWQSCYYDTTPFKEAP